MGNSNKKVREELERRYGRKCMMHEGLKIKGYKKVEGRYKGKKGQSLMKQLTLHHIKALKDGGKTTTYNGSVLCRRLP